MVAFSCLILSQIGFILAELCQVTLSALKVDLVWGGLGGSWCYEEVFWCYGYYKMKALEKLVRFIYSKIENHATWPRYGNYRFWIPIYL